MRQGLYKKLEEYSKEDWLPMHMPGHKRNSEFLFGLPNNIDITEIDGFDNLHNMEGVLKDTAVLAAGLYGAKICFPVVNGSSAAILAAITHATGGKGKLIIARNCHKSVYNAAVLNGLDVKYIYSDADDYGICKQIDHLSLEKIIDENRDASAVVITSPTFEGVVSDILKIAQVCHKKGIKLIVDAAHGAHFGFDENYPENATRLGADYTIMSLHKTLPALTQCALLAIAEGIDASEVGYALSLFETTSPSYVLLASIDECLRTLDLRSAELFTKLKDNLTDFYAKCESLRKLKVMHYDDISRIVLLCRGTQYSGGELAEVLRREYYIEPEMAYADRVVLITTICDKAAAFERLFLALSDIDKKCVNREVLPMLLTPHVKQIMSLKEASFSIGEEIPIQDSFRRVCSEYIFAYPPGIPIVAAGEEITDEVIDFLNRAEKYGIELKGTRSKKGRIFVLKQRKIR